MEKNPHLIWELPAVKQRAVLEDSLLVQEPWHTGENRPFTQAEVDKWRLGLLLGWGYSEVEAKQRMAGLWDPAEPNRKLYGDSAPSEIASGLAQLQGAPALLGSVDEGSHDEPGRIVWPDAAPYLRGSDPVNYPDDGFDWEELEDAQIAASGRKDREVATIRTGISWRGLNEKGCLVGYYRDRSQKHVIEIVPPGHSWKNEPVPAGQYLAIVNGERVYAPGSGGWQRFATSFAAAAGHAAEHLYQRLKFEPSQSRLRKPLPTHLAGPEEGQPLAIEAVKNPTGVGYYLGTQHKGQPLSRASVEYWPNREEASRALKSGDWTSSPQLSQQAPQLRSSREVPGRVRPDAGSAQPQSRTR